MTGGFIKSPTCLLLALNALPGAVAAEKRAFSSAAFRVMRERTGEGSFRPDPEDAKNGKAGSWETLFEGYGEGFRSFGPHGV
jgi:hypothetical protein